MSNHAATGHEHDSNDEPAAHELSHAAGSAPNGHAGHDKHAGHDPEMFRRRFWWSLVLTIPLVVTSDMVMEWSATDEVNRRPSVQR